MAKTRPYFLVYKGEPHIIDAAQAAQAVQHIVGADVSELRPARAAEVSAWVREGKEIPIAGQVSEASAKSATSTADDAEMVLHPVLAGHEQALIFFEDWAGFDRAEAVNTEQATDTVKIFCRMHPAGQMDLMTFDVLRQRAPEFGGALVAAELGIPRDDDETYVAGVLAQMDAGLARLRAKLEEQPMAFGDVVKAVLHHAGVDQAAA